jgi:hypothetical protein
MANENISKILICGPPKMNESMSLILRKRYNNSSLYLILWLHIPNNTFDNLAELVIYYNILKLKNNLDGKFDHSQIICLMKVFWFKFSLIYQCSK